MNSKITLKIEGMTCGHCVSSVTEELQDITGVETVKVDLVAGGASTANVVISEPVQSLVFEAAVAEAGYRMIE